MWNIISILILVVEILLLLGFIIGRFKRRKLNETVLFIAAVFAVNLSLHILPLIYNITVLGKSINPALGIVECFGSSMKLFVGEPSVGAVEEFAETSTSFVVAYILGVIIALATTISTTIEALGDHIINGFRLKRALMGEKCDIVIGDTKKSLSYIKGRGAVLLLDECVSKDVVKERIEAGYAVLHKSFTAELLSGRYFNRSTRYNLICPESENPLERVETFINYKKASKGPKSIYLYAEFNGEQAEVVRREIIEKNGMGSYIDTFSTNELIARAFAEENPITRYMPSAHIENGAIRLGTEINVFILGYDELGKELYHKSILNNQLVEFDNEYRVAPINYYLCDTGIDRSEWSIEGLRDALGELNGDDYMPLPEMPYAVAVIDKSPSSPELIRIIKNKVQNCNGYTVIIVNTPDECQSIEIGARLKTMLFGMNGYHVFVRSDAEYVENDEFITYFGGIEGVFNHDVIVNESLSNLAKRLCEVYTAQYASDEERSRQDFADYIRKKAEDDWRGFDYFTLYSNIYSAMNLRLKLNLIGLDYIKDGKGKGTALIKERIGYEEEYAYDRHFTPSVRNALIAQEHARWNAYHLLNEYLPLASSGITIKSTDGTKPRFTVKSTAAKRHACLTTYMGLNELSGHLAERAAGEYTAKDYNYYSYDEMLISSADETLLALGYSIIEK